MSLESNFPKNIGLIAGGSSYPVLLAEEAKRRNIGIYAIAIKGLTLRDIQKYAVSIKWIEFGEFLPLIEFFKESGIKYAIMAGNVKKQDIFKNINSDALTKKILLNSGDKSDMVLLDIVAKELKKNSIELLDARTFLDEYIPKKGCLTEVAPKSLQWEDVLFGWKLAKTISSFDVGLTVVVKNKVVLAIEAVEGTDEAIRRAAKFGGEGFVVVKVARPNQDMRFELPVVGLDTVKLLIGLKTSVLAIEAEKTLFFNIKESIKEASENGFSIIAL